MSISTELRALYAKKAEQINEALAAIETEDDPKAKYLDARLQKVLDIYARLGRTNDKKNIMQESKDLFYDKDFNNAIDTNQHLLCCKNGIWDFKEKVFRDGKPEDYISMCTNLEYIVLSEKTKEIEEEIRDFMAKLFPEESLREYMWDHLSSTLVGTALNQTFNNYLGGGRNGKSVLVSLMSKTLGEYKGELPLTAVVTQRRVGVGGLSPEILKLKGKRYAVMQEPRQGDVLNEGILKELTSGMDAIQARGLFHDTVTFIPQFKLVVCANILPEIKAQDHGTWRRIRVIPFKSLFTENPVEGDPHKPYQFLLDAAIDEKFDSWKTVFLSMLVDRVLKTGGRVADCDIVLKESNDYKHKQDVITQFIEEKIMDAPGESVKTAAINESFKIWHESNFGTKGPQPKEIHSQLDRLYGQKDKEGWKGIRLRYDTNNREEKPNADEIDDVDF
jgi:P4 family phage/plasmid primase-like protien